MHVFPDYSGYYARIFAAPLVAIGVGKEVSGSVLPVVAGTVATGVGEGVSGSVYSLW